MNQEIKYTGMEEISNANATNKFEGIVKKVKDFCDRNEVVVKGFYLAIMASSGVSGFYRGMNNMPMAPLQPDQVTVTDGIQIGAVGIAMAKGIELMVRTRHSKYMTDDEKIMVNTYVLPGILITSGMMHMGGYVIGRGIRDCN